MSNEWCPHATSELIKCQKAFNELNEKSNKHKWISVADRMPEKDGRYLVVEEHYTLWIGVASMRGGKFDIPIKYWQDLPHLPDELK